MTKFNRETETVEYKESLTEKEKGYNSLVAMLNKHGNGTLYFGIRDDGKVIGVDIGKNTLRSISQDIYNSIQPQIIPEILVHESDGKNYISISVHGDQRPYAKNGLYLIRSGEENRVIPPSELRKLFQSCSDLLKEADAFNQDLTFNELISDLAANGIHTDNPDRIIRSFGLVRSDGRYNMQAELLSDQNPFPLTVAIFQGDDRTALSYRTDFSGHGLIHEVKSAIMYIEALNDVKVDMTSFIRKDTPLFDNDSFREAWLNATVHNTWTLGIPPYIQVFDDRMEIISNGSIPYGQTKEEFFEGISMPVNESLMRVFIATGLCEHTGHGVPVILKRYGEDAFEIGGNSVRVKIPFERKRRIISDEGEHTDTLSEKERNVLSILMTNPKITLKDVSEILSIGQSNVLATVSGLKAKGVLIREGSKKNGEWKVLIR